MFRPGPSTPTRAGLARPLVTHSPSTRLCSLGWSASVSSNDPGRPTTRAPKPVTVVHAQNPSRAGHHDQHQQGDQHVAGRHADDEREHQRRRGDQAGPEPHELGLGPSVALLAILDHLDSHRAELTRPRSPDRHPRRGHRRRRGRRGPGDVVVTEVDLGQVLHRELGGPLPPRGDELARPVGVVEHPAQRHRERRRVARRHELGVLAVTGDGGVADEVAGDDRRVRGHRLEQHDAERLAAERRRAEHVGAPQASCLLLVADATQPGDAGVAGHALLERRASRARRSRSRGERRGAGAPWPRAARPGPCGARGDRRRRWSARRSGSARRPGTPPPRPR